MGNQRIFNALRSNRKNRLLPLLPDQSSGFGQGFIIDNIKRNYVGPLGQIARNGDIRTARFHLCQRHDTHRQISLMRQVASKVRLIHRSDRMA